MALFYVPEWSLYTKKNEVVTEESVEDSIAGWQMSEVFKNDKKTHGTLLSNDIPWQSKWYLKFDPPKTASELGIEQYWSYEAPKLANFAESSDFDLKSDTSQMSTLGKSSLSTLKNMATVVLSGNTHEALKREAYRREAYKAESEADRASAFSMQLKMPTNESGQTKLSMLEKFNLTTGKNPKMKISHTKKS